MNMRQFCIFFRFSKVIRQFVWLYPCFVRVSNPFVNLKLHLCYITLKIYRNQNKTNFMFSVLFMNLTSCGNEHLSHIYLAVQMPHQSWSTVCINKGSLHYTVFLPFLLHYLRFISKSFQFNSGAYLERVLWVILLTILKNRLLAPVILGHFSNVGKNCGC